MKLNNAVAALSAKARWRIRKFLTPRLRPITYDQAGRHLERLAAGDARLKDVELVDVSTPALLKRHNARGPVCLVGSKTYKMTEEQVSAWRRFYERLDDYEFVGIDIEAGLNVDVVADLCDPAFQGKYPQLLARFGWVICGALLEHVKDPFSAARNVAALVKPGGCIYYLGPWSWGYHPYPDDFWRFSMSGVKQLFPGFTWKEWFYASTNKNIGVRLADVAKERDVFKITKSIAKPETLADLLTDRTMPYLNIGAVGERSA